MSSATTFRGDGDLMVDSLVRASAVRGPVDPLKERQLTPFFIDNCGTNPGIHDINVALAVKPERVPKTERRDPMRRESRQRSDESSGPLGQMSQSTPPMTPPQKRPRSRHVRGIDGQGGDLSSSPPNSQRILRLVQPSAESTAGAHGVARRDPSASINKISTATTQKASSVAQSPQQLAPSSSKFVAKSSPPRSGMHHSSSQPLSQQPACSLWAGPAYSKAPSPDALPLPSFGRSQSEPVAALLAPEPSAAAARALNVIAVSDASDHLRKMLSIYTPPPPALAAQPAPAPRIPDATMALRQLLGVPTVAVA